MPRVVLVGNLAQVTGGVAEFHLPATSVKQLFQQLAERTRRWSVISRTEAGRPHSTGDRRAARRARRFTEQRP